MASKVDRDVVRMSLQLDIAVSALDELLSFRFDPMKPVADRIRVKAKAQKALDDIRKLDNTNTTTDVLP